MTRDVSEECPLHDVTETEHLWIPMPDGVQLAARVWLPESAAATPVPAILEIIPYRKGDMVRARDERNHPFFAKHSYACLRVDMRGSGDSEGHMPDMYAVNELEDTRAVIDWIAAQPWCSGAVGMFGTSWGGTAGLQASLDPPEALKAVIAVCATHDRYEDDIHHMGGLLLTDSIEWGATLPAILAAPPSAATVGDDWRPLWEERLERLAFPLEAWVQQEERGPYWQWGSVRHQAARIDCPVLAIGGWSDRYSNSVMSLVEARPDRVWGIVGPWGHHYPDAAHPGPGINFHQEALAWWNYWLRGDPAPPPWPRLRLWLRDFDPPADAIDRRNGDWIELADRASAETEPLILYLHDGSLAETSNAVIGEALIPHDLSIGSAAGDTGYFGRFGGLPLDQGQDDWRSLTYETGLLPEPLVIIGAVEAVLEVISDQPLAQVALRIIDVAPDGQAARVTFALRNLALDNDLVSGNYLEPGKPRQVRIRFPTAAYRFAPGHRIRLALSASYWPLAWPSAEAPTLRLRQDRSLFDLPIATTTPKCLVHPFASPEPQPENFTRRADGKLTRHGHREPDGSLVSGWHQDFTSLHFPQTETAIGYETRAHTAIHPDDPSSACCRFDHRMQIERPDGTARITTCASIGTSREAFELVGNATVLWNDETIFRKDWRSTLPRRLS